MKHYNTGKPCRNGHLANRLVSTGACVACQAASVKRWKKRNPETYAKKKKADAAKYGYSEGAKKRMREYYRKKLGIPKATRVCPSNCESCGRPLGNGKQTHLDHDHPTGKFRGWLCNSCNLGIGMLGDSIEGLMKALAYLRRAHITNSRLA